jgi:hypothetical protein
MRVVSSSSAHCSESLLLTNANSELSTASTASRTRRASSRWSSCSCSPRARDEAALSTWTWREFFQHTRGTHPFWCSDDLPGENGGALYQLTAKGAAYQGRLFTADFLDYTGVPFKARWLGAFA